MNECNICLEEKPETTRCDSCLHCYICEDCIVKYHETKCPVCRAENGFTMVEVVSNDFFEYAMELWSGSGLERNVLLNLFPEYSWVTLLQKSKLFSVSSVSFTLERHGDIFMSIPEMKWRIIPKSSPTFYQNGELLPEWEHALSTETIVSVLEFKVTDSMIEKYKRNLN